MFSRSFSARSFSPESWRFPESSQVAPAQVYGGGAAARLYSDEDLRALIDAKYEALEHIARPAQPWAEPPKTSATKPAPGAVAAVAAVALALPEPAQALAPMPRTDTAGPALAPGAAERARLARRKDDEEALLMVLLEAV